MAQADVVLTVDDARPTAEALEMRATSLAGRQVYQR